MAFNAVQEFSAVSSEQDRPDRKVPCIRCKAAITIIPSVGNGKSCWACALGWTGPTRPVRDLTNHPYYAKIVAEQMSKKKMKAYRKRIREVGA